MNTAKTAIDIRRLTAWLDENSRGAGFSAKFVSEAPIGEAYITIDSDAQAPAASFNLNRAYLCGGEGQPTRELGRALRALFVAAGVRRFFVWLSPGKDEDLVKSWLQMDGYLQNTWTRYPTLALLEPPQTVRGSTLSVREVNRAEVLEATDVLGEAMGEEYRATAGKLGFHHFMAFDGGRPAAVAALAIRDHIGYLTYASTAEGYRRKGAQQALIASRVRKARELGCAEVYSETLSKLRDSLSNLNRAGFREIYNKAVYCLDLDAPPRS